MVELRRSGCWLPALAVDWHGLGGRELDESLGLDARGGLDACLVLRLVQLRLVQLRFIRRCAHGHRRRADVEHATKLSQVLELARECMRERSHLVDVDAHAEPSVGHQWIAS